ncbi:DUF2690 domain-containing protein [Phytohabitans suffuscus]|uniref:DUF2690 domain-containing protein n=1 Tax=Phytohabitans suffuscus TaxID=624315 RepID=A0A6F8YTC5_9ACTN|nr:DUF2690 domain-containing protein [Phytohabitans suffuscus]BCB89306.1 hypothetical protein Psuf_066190 [Phytohabitans suffuscus]
MLKRALARVLLVLVGVSGVIAVPTAAYAVSCSGAGCDGDNPQEYGCSQDAFTVLQHHDRSAGTVQMRYSFKCAAAWARTSAGGIGFRIERQSPNRIETGVGPPYGGDAWTRMVGGVFFRARVCVTVPVSGGALSCSGWQDVGWY